MNRDFLQLAWSPQIEEDCRRIVRLAVFEDLDRGYDWTTVALVPAGATAAADVVARQAGVVAGLEAARIALDEMDIEAQWRPAVRDGDAVEPGTVLASLSGSARDLLTSERILLNLIGRLSGIATLTRRYVQAIAGTQARLYDTRKTTPGWRRLEKYAVHCGGGNNHRTGLFDAVLIKDNHLALGRQAGVGSGFTPAEAVARARQFVAESLAGEPNAAEMAALIVEIEVDSLAQLAEVLPAGPDIVLLDNMTLDQLRQAVALRDAAGSAAELEASGGVNLDTVRGIAETGVERISVGALTHSAIGLDVGLDWRL
ncbi:MAG: carboxylating nicotinate-nucleotide diphosphorylase [Pirellulaceae bacterium]